MLRLTPLKFTVNKTQIDFSQKSILLQMIQQANIEITTNTG